MKSSSLKAERELRGWSQSKIAELLGTTTKTVGRWERGEAVPYPHYREQLCMLFGKNAQQLGWLQGEEEQTLPMQDAKEMDAECLSLALTEPWLLQDPAIPQVLSENNPLLGRYDFLMQVKESLLAAESLTAIALTGLPGIGKTALAVVVAMDQQVQNHFVDGILWAGLGPSGNVLSQLIRWGKLLGVTSDQVETIKSPQAWGQALRTAIGTRRLLLIIDDAWTAEDALALQVGGPECVHLLTTHVSQVASSFALRGSMEVPPLEDADGLALLAYFIPRLVQQDPESARKLVRAVENVPLALMLMGKYLASQTLTGQSQSLRATLAQFYKIQESLRVTMPSTWREQSPSLAEEMPLYLYATIAICNQYLSSQAHAALCALSVFASRSNSFSKEVALEVSQQSVETLDELLDVGLLQRWGSDRYTLHLIVADYVRAQHEALVAQQQSEEVQIPQRGPYSSGEPRSLQDSGMGGYISRGLKSRSRMQFFLLPLLTLAMTCLATLAVIALLLVSTWLPFLSSIEQVPHNPTVQLPVSTSYEAESGDNTLIGGARVYKCSRCSGRKKVGYIGTRGILQFNNISKQSAGNYLLTIYYIDGSGKRTLYLNVNGGSAIALHMPNTGNWSVVGSFNIPVSLNAGYNTIEFFNPSAYAPDIDRIVV